VNKKENFRKTGFSTEKLLKNQGKCAILFTKENIGGYLYGKDYIFCKPEGRRG
jgi:hypothetical protein